MDNISRLDSIGSEKIEFEEVQDVVEGVLGNFIERIHQNLRDSDSLVSGKIADISIERQDDGTAVMANGWLLYQDKGINGSEVKLYDTPYAFKGKRPPVEPFKQWVKSKNLQKRNNAKYYGKESDFKQLSDDEQINSAAYAIREKVYKEGIPPKNVVSKEIPKLADDLAENIADFCAQRFLDSLNFNNK